MSDPMDDVLKHYGVKGMRWGQRKAHLNSTNYGSRDRVRDTSMYGTRGTKRIESHVEGGKTIKQARRKEFRRQTAQVALGAASVLTLLAAPGVAKVGAATLVNKRQANAASFQAAQDLIDKYGVTAYKTLVL
jgi:hypothetical protein